MARVQRQALKAVGNGPPGKKAEAPPEPVELSTALKRAIESMSHDRLKALVKHYCKSIEPLRNKLEKKLLVAGREVVRYHIDSDSENDQNSENESSEEEEEANGSYNDSDELDEDKEPRKKLKPIAAADSEMVPKYATCLNCKTEFDVTLNDRGDCRWHSGEKEAYHDDDFWADHDEDCHGDIDSFIDDFDYAEGFKWSCCDELGDNEGCKSTKHKATVNEIRNCGRRFDVYDNEAKSCLHHPRGVDIDNEGEHWCDWDEDCHGDIWSLRDDPDHADGFMWSCCEGPLDDPGCQRRRHEL
ncbi:hypothetical protein BGZ57DRAFT_347927 [Hyaloscypha finlandica]|nr:hypothetical protein BGZ57DRAFT_347927 [Hyaloscypha finlandica]